MNTVPATEQIISMIQEASSQYYRLVLVLVLVVGPAGSGKSQILRETSSLTNAPILNISLDLSKRISRSLLHFLRSCKADI
jgi:ABC-type polar amino acid transport system ATPase subunit